MGASWVAMTVFTVIWAVVGIIMPIFVPKGPNKGIIQVTLMLTAFTCWLFWLCCYMAQMNPLIGPQMKGHALLLLQCEWDGNCLEKKS